jgi:tRNA threonylcarbamoyladenosine biosynthesis protein TsaB
MRLLAIDTASEACSVGVVDGERVFLHSENVGHAHAERLMGMIAAAVADAGMSVADIARIAVTVGPGSFTGLRVGIAATRGLALVTGAEMVGISTLAVHAEEARAAEGPRTVLAVLAAGRGEIYGAVFGPSGTETSPPRTASAQTFAALVVADTVLAGSGSDLVAAALPMDLRPTIAHRAAAPGIAALCRLGLSMTSQDKAPRPLYLRAPDARPQAAAVIPRQ